MEYDECEIQVGFFVEVLKIYIFFYIYIFENVASLEDSCTQARLVHTFYDKRREQV